MPFGVSSGIPNVIIHAKFHVDRLRGFWAPRTPKSAISYTYWNDPYNSPALYRADCDNPTYIRWLQSDFFGSFSCLQVRLFIDATPVIFTKYTHKIIFVKYIIKVIFKKGMHFFLNNLRFQYSQTSYKVEPTENLCSPSSTKISNF